MERVGKEVIEERTGTDRRGEMDRPNVLFLFFLTLSLTFSLSLFYKHTFAFLSLIHSSIVVLP